MLLKVELPRFSGQMDDARVVEWLVGEGEGVQFGQPLVDLEADSAKHLKRDKRADSWSKGRVRKKNQDEEFAGSNVRVRLRLVASESGYLRKIVTPEGERAAIGDLLAYVTSGESEAVNGEEDAAMFRVVANLMEGPRI